MNVKVKFTEGFKDGTIFPKSFDPGEIAVLTEQQLGQVQRSGGVVEVLEHVIANPLKAEKLAEEKAKREPNDPLNAENSINELETHVADYEENLTEERKADMKRRADPNVKKVGVESVFNEESARIDAEAQAKVEEARLEREKKHRAEREKTAEAEAQLAEEVAEEERKEYVDAKVKADSKKRKK